MRKSTANLTQLLAQTRNPLLMVRGCNPIPEDAKRGKYGRGESRNLPFYEQFQALYKEAITFTGSKNIVFGLEVDYSDTDQGLGGFYNAGYVPLNLFSQLREDHEKDLRFYWPHDPHSPEGKRMRYQGSINLGVWPRVLHDAMATAEQYWENGKSFVCGTNISRPDAYEYLECDIWMHLFSSMQADFETPIPDCQVRFTSEFNFANIDETHTKIIEDIYGNKHFTPEQIKELVVKFQEEQAVKDDGVKPPKSFFCNIRPRFYFDGLKRTAKLEALAERGNWGEGLMESHRGDCQIYGRPRSQQEAKRFISPDSYNGIRALTPMFAFDDVDADMTHQFYADALMMDDISHKRAYCKLDSSCT